MVRQLITEPEAFISERVNQRGALREIIVVLLVGALGALGMYFMSQEVLAVTESDEMRLVLVGYVLGPVLITIVLWVIYSVVLHFAARFYRGRGQLRRMFIGTAWAFVPLGIGNLAQSIGMYVVLLDFDVTGELDGIGPDAQLESLLSAMIGEPIMIGATVVFLAMLVWTAYLMTIVLTEAQTNLTREEAIKLVAPIVGIQFLFAVWALVSESTNFALML